MGFRASAAMACLTMVYPKLIYFNVVDSGGHFAAWQEPALFAAGVRAAFRTRR